MKRCEICKKYIEYKDYYMIKELVTKTNNKKTILIEYYHFICVNNALKKHLVIKQIASTNISWKQN